MAIIDSVQSAGRTTWKWIKRVLLLCILLSIGWLCFIIFATYSEGTRTGYVTKISKKGYVFKTFEGELNTGFFTNPGPTGKIPDNVWYFSVSNADVAAEVQKASETNNKVTLYYHQKYRKLFFRGETEYMVYKVEPNHEVPAPGPGQ
ncbi:MAG TPA: hypothetical protein PKD32_05405 [Saprospiraceae bacterium]|nr:hypothetical protein [Saprospiraceae bacterium]